MKKIVYYISEYGYGHAARSIAVIRELLRQNPYVEIEVVNQFALDFLKKSLSHKNVTFFELSTDIGYFLKEGSIEPDQNKQVVEVERYLEALPNLINSEINRLEKEKIDLIISDISPLAFEVAEQIEVPSLGISNFTWHTAFLDLVPLEILAPLKASYHKMDFFFALAGSNEMKWTNKTTKNYGFYSREINIKEINHIRSKIGWEKRIVFLGLGMKMELNELQNLPIWKSSNTHFIISSNLNIEHPNVSKIPNDYLETQNYIAACDLVITKAGWGTVGEAVAADVPLLIIEREGMREDQNTIDYLKAKNLAKTISGSDFKDLVLNDNNKFLNTKYQKNQSNVIKEIAEDILRLIH
ncbi:hypothetical protein WQ54_05310 [Bacillus sp. SA1-12]|uniref:glycosyltransferase family protein n=1 Tax=Bacillus sp. SA1-12 TaxID=1455638 RepID=UPI000625447D|nr:glycosyltransferase family protein [Bacillus sp. SA1-12]KKI93254.1 hypothetical protein WQ54_05310 [Bacillus sp. SA1-12]